MRLSEQYGLKLEFAPEGSRPSSSSSTVGRYGPRQSGSTGRKSRNESRRSNPSCPPRTPSPSTTCSRSCPADRNQCQREDCWEISFRHRRFDRPSLPPAPYWTGDLAMQFTDLPEAYREALLLVRTCEIGVRPTPQQRRVLDRLYALGLVRFRQVRTINGTAGAYSLTAEGKETIPNHE